MIKTPLILFYSLKKWCLELKCLLTETKILKYLIVESNTGIVVLKTLQKEELYCSIVTAYIRTSHPSILVDRL